MTHISIGDYDPFDSRVIANPYPYYELLRREAPVHRLERYGFYVVTRYADVEAVLNDHETFSSAWGPGPAKVIQPIRNILNSDPPEHTALRSIMADAFAPETLQRIEPRVAALCESLTERLAQTGRADLVSDFAVPLPMDVIAQLLGVPVEDRNSFKSWSDDIVAEIGTRRSATLARRAFSDYLRPLIAERKARPRDDLITRLLQPAGSEPLSDQEVIAFCQALLVAGNENVSGLIGNLFLALARRPDEWKRLRDDPGRVPAAGTESPSPPTRSSSSRSAPRTEIRTASPTRSASTSRASPTRTWPSARASTAAWERRWPGFRPSSPCEPPCAASARSGCSKRIRRTHPSSSSAVPNGSPSSWSPRRNGKRSSPARASGDSSVRLPAVASDGPGG
jgi:cytochrome P450